MAGIKSRFNDLLLKPQLLRAISDCGFENPTEEQSESIPNVILGYDVLCEAKPGTGKTTIFVLGTLQQMDPTGDHVHVLIMAPTRELAVQISKEYERLSAHMPIIKVCAFVGGTSIDQNTRDLNSIKPNVVIGTPGRISFLVRSDRMDLKQIDHFVLDECDKMMEQPGMRHDIKNIFSRTQSSKQVLMFSSSLSDKNRSACKEFMIDPIELCFYDMETLLPGLNHTYIKLSDGEKKKKLIALLDILEYYKVIIFVNTVGECLHLENIFAVENIPALAIHSGLPQADRFSRHELFQGGEKRILIATDVFGRGIDIAGVNLVINYDVPSHCDKYLHRVARASRSDSKAIAVMFVSDDSDAEMLQNIQGRFHFNIVPLRLIHDPSPRIEYV